VSRLRTASLVHGHAADRGATVTVLPERERLAHVDPRVWKLLFRCLQPVDIDELRAEGFEDDVIEAARSLRLVVDADADCLWEEHRWTRGAHLLFSQLDAAYVDDDATDGTDTRRHEVARYLRERPYPPRRPYEGTPFALPEPAGEPPIGALDALATRRSVRAFARRAVPVATIAEILWAATVKVREAERAQASGDPYELLNSYYAWLDLHIVNQGIDGLPPGVHRYDPLEHVLWRTRDDAADDEVVAIAAHQPWAAGSGAAIFLAVQWDRWRWLYRSSRGYMTLLVQAGEFSQELLGAIYRRRLGAWVTPAIHETSAAKLLSLPAGIDALMLVKLGPAA